MRTLRNDKSTVARYSSFAEVAAAFGKKPVEKKNNKKIKKIRETFTKKYICRACGKPMTFIGGNQMVCQNESCKGIKIFGRNKAGEEVVSYAPSYCILKAKDARYAQKIFS